MTARLDPANVEPRFRATDKPDKPTEWGMPISDIRQDIEVVAGNISGGRVNMRFVADIWNNSGDKATLKNRAGTTLDTCSWSITGVGYKYC